MLESLSVGDEIMTRGGVLGTIVELRTHESGEKLMVIETGSGAEKTTMTFTVQALLINYTKTKQHQEQLAKQKAEKESKRSKDKAKESEAAETEFTESSDEAASDEVASEENPTKEDKND